MKSIAIISVATLLLGFAIAECPNGCSGQGTCSARDQCNCDKNYEGNDCSLRTCPHAYAFIDTPKGELNMDGQIKSSWELTDSQRYPAGGYEFFNPDASANEAHFYMECANRGLCDRETGTCTCFDGYEGSACQRTVCPNDCNGHGTCESISELASNRGGNLFHKDTYHGDQTYSLWDQKVSYGCKCDPGYYGADCSLRRCKVGVDPMYEAAGQEIIETILFRFGADDTSNTDEVLETSSYVRVRFFDYWGESYQTERITFAGSSGTDATALLTARKIQDGFLALPNGVVTDVTCGDSTSTDVDNVLATSDDTKMSAIFGTGMHGILIGCKFTSNPGALRLPEITEYNIVGKTVDAPTTTIAKLTGSSKRGEDLDYFGQIETAQVTTLAAAGTAMTTSGTATLSDFDYTASNHGALLMKIKDQYIAVSKKATNTWTLMYAWPLGALTSATESLFYQSTKMTQDDGDTSVIDAWAIGSKTFTAKGSPVYQVGDIIFAENQIFSVVTVSSTTVTVDRPFAGQAADGSAIATGATNILLYWTTTPTTNTFTYVTECSGRGLCDAESGVCQCFKGYTNDNCDTQNILAF